MNHDAVAKALCGRYIPLAESSGYLQTHIAMPENGSLIGAYVVDLGGGLLRVSDDGDILFNAAATGSELNRSRNQAYAAIAQYHGFNLAGGNLEAVCGQDELPTVVGRFVQAACAMASLAVKHRPKDSSRFENLVGVALIARYGTRVKRRVDIQGISGHAVQFQFVLDVESPNATLIQTIAAEDGKLIWPQIWTTGGKFSDVRALRDDVRMVAVLEDANDVAHARRFFADKASVTVYPQLDVAA